MKKPAGQFNVTPKPNKKRNAWYKVGKSNNASSHKPKREDK